VNLREFNRILREILIVPIIALLLLAVFVLWQIKTTADAQRWLDRSDEITSQIQELQRRIIDQETGLRGFQLTNDPAMLSPFKQASAPIDKQFNVLHDLLSDSEEQSKRLAILHDRYELWLGFAQSVLAKDPATIGNPQMNQHGNELMENVRTVVHDLLHAEGRVRHQRSLAAADLERHELIVILISAVAIGLFLGLFARIRFRAVSRSYEAAINEAEKRANDLFESRQWFKTTLESIGDGVISCDLGDRVQFMNAVAENLTGWHLQEALGQPVEQVFRILNEESRQPAENPIEKVRRLQRVIGVTNHTVLLSRSGKEYRIDDSAAPIRDRNGKMTGVVLIFRDVTEVRRTEAALIAGEKLAVAGRLAASIAHEIHNPLDSVANLHFLIGHEDDPSTRAEYLQLAQQELGRTMQISRTMLSLYREPKAPVEVDLADLLKGVLLLLERRLAHQEITVERDFPASLVIEGFPAELRQVFTNIIVNAVEAVGAKGRIHIHMERVPAEEFRAAGAVVEITDSGPGIADQISENLFQPFFTTKGEEGTGLGLWVSLGIVQKHGGAIRIANSANHNLHGASVRVYLPFHTLASASSRSTAYLRE